MAQGGRRVKDNVIIQQDNVTNRSRVNTVVVCALTTNMKRAKAPGNVPLDAGEANLSKRSVVVASQVSTVDKADLGDYIGSVDERRVSQILAGMRFLQWFTGRGGEEQAATDLFVSSRVLDPIVLQIVQRHRQ